jgi:hypothetical protein
MYAKRGAQGAPFAYVCSSSAGGCGGLSIQMAGADAEVADRVLTFLSRVELRPIGDQDPAVLRQALANDEASLVDLSRARFVEQLLTNEEFRPARDELMARVEAARTTLPAWERSAAASGLVPGGPE